MRYKDIRPQPMDSLAALLEAAFDEVHAMADAVAEADAALETASADLSRGTSLVLLCLRYVMPYAIHMAARLLACVCSWCWAHVWHSAEDFGTRTLCACLHTHGPCTSDMHR